MTETRHQLEQNPVNKNYITRSEAFKWFRYENGSLYWNNRPINEFKNHRDWKCWNTRFAGRVAGTVRKYGHLVIHFNNAMYQVHRVVFLMHHGYMPRFIDHIDGNAGNNLISNLRAATASQNQYNQKLRTDNKSGFKCIGWHKKNKSWSVSIISSGKRIHVGSFKNLEDAITARNEALKKYHGEYACTRGEALNKEPV